MFCPFDHYISVSSYYLIGECGALCAPWAHVLDMHSANFFGHSYVWPSCTLLMTAASWLLGVVPCLRLAFSPALIVVPRPCDISCCLGGMVPCPQSHARMHPNLRHGLGEWPMQCYQPTFSTCPQAVAQRLSWDVKCGSESPPGQVNRPSRATPSCGQSLASSLVFCLIVSICECLTACLSPPSHTSVLFSFA